MHAHCTGGPATCELGARPGSRTGVRTVTAGAGGSYARSMEPTHDQADTRIDRTWSDPAVAGGAAGAGPSRLRRCRDGAALLSVAALLAFLLPFGTVSCDGEEVSFTGLELVTRQVQPDPAAAGAPDQGLAGDVETEAGTYALAALVFAAGCLVSAVWRARGGGFALASLLSLLVLLLDAASTEAEVEIGVGYWAALASTTGAGLLRLGSRRRARRRRSQDPPPVPRRGGRLRRLAPSVLLAVTAIAVVVLVEALTTRDSSQGAGSANVGFATADSAPVWSSDGQRLVLARSSMCQSAGSGS